MINLDSLDKLLGKHINGDTNNVRYACPLCSNEFGEHYAKIEHPNKLWVNIHNGKWQCFSCESHRGQNINQLYQRLGELIEPSASSALHDVIQIFSSTEKENKVREFYLPDLMMEIVPGDIVYNYIVETRKLPAEIINHYKLKSCLTVSEGSPYRCVFFPVYENGVLCYWQVRSLIGRVFKNPEYGRNNYIFNIDHQFRTGVICEGMFSAISAGYDGEALLGKSCSDIQFTKLLSKGYDIYYICLDNDFFEECILLADKFFNYNRDARIIILPQGSDPNDIEYHEFLGYKNSAIKYDRSTITLSKLFQFITTRQGRRKIERHYQLTI